MPVTTPRSRIAWVIAAVVLAIAILVVLALAYGGGAAPVVGAATE
jgi:hypothetical protein